MAHKFGEKKRRGIYEVYPYTWKELQTRKRERKQLIIAIIALIVIEASVYVSSKAIASLLN